MPEITMHPGICAWHDGIRFHLELMPGHGGTSTSELISRFKKVSTVSRSLA